MLPPNRNFPNARTLELLLEIIFIMTKRQSNRLGNQHQREDETEGCSSSALLGTSSPYALHQDDAERQQQRQAQHEDDSLTASATPSPFDYSEFSRYVVSSTPGNMTPNGRALKLQQHRGGSFSSAASLLSSNSLSGGAPFKKRELLAWTFVVVQSCIIAFLSRIVRGAGGRALGNRGRPVGVEDTMWGGVLTYMK